MRKVGFNIAKATRTGPFAGKTYAHLSNVGIENRALFNSKEDFDRFEAYLYLLNAIESPRVSNYFGPGRSASIFDTARGEKLVGIGAYSFTPQGFQILATPLREGGISKFMQKVQTAYTMYFNIKYRRAGRLFQSSYQRKNIESEKDLKYYFSLVHLSPAILFDADWNQASADQLFLHASRALQYRYSSSNEYGSSTYLITSPEEFPPYIKRAKGIEPLLRFYRK